MRADEDVADFHRCETFRLQIREGVHVAERFRHFPAVHQQVRDVEPMRREVPAARAFALCDLVFVVGENEIHTAGVHVEGIAEVFADHRRALEVPAGPAFTPRGLPEILAILLPPRLPQDEVGNTIFLVLVRIGTGGLRFPEVELALVEAGEPAVIRERGDAEIDRAVVGCVGVAFFDEFRDHRDLLRDVGDGGWLDVWWKAGERLAIGVEFLRPDFRESL